MVGLNSSQTHSWHFYSVSIECLLLSFVSVFSYKNQNFFCNNFFLQTLRTLWPKFFITLYHVSVKFVTFRMSAILFYFILTSRYAGQLLAPASGFGLWLRFFHQLGPTGPSCSQSRHVRLCVCVSVCLRHRVQFFFRPLIGPQVT